MQAAVFLGFRTLANGKKEHLDINGQSVLDLAVPYPFNEEGKPAGPYPTGTNGQAIDSPHGTVDATESFHKRDDSYIMYVMFKASGTNSRWVPLKQVWWWWTGTATFENANWTLSASGQGPDPLLVGNVTSLPEWDRNSEPKFWVEDQ